MDIKILIYSDIHWTGIMPDAMERLKVIIDAAQKQKADAILCLGDTAWSKPEFQPIADLWNSIPIPHYMVLGNHDMDRNSKDEVTAFYGMPANYYSFDVKGLHFVALDTNYCQKNGEEAVLDYDHANYAGQITDRMPEKELEWLREDLKRTEKPTILLSHAPLCRNQDDFHYCKDYEAVHKIMLEHNQSVGWRQAFLSCNGHSHVDSYFQWDGLHYLSINSASNQWLGEEYELLEPDETFSADQHEEYSCLRYTAPFRDAVYAFLTFSLEDKTFHVQGMESEYIGKHPAQRGYTQLLCGAPLTAATQERLIHWE